MFRSPTITTLDRFHLFLPLPLISAHSVLPVLKSTFNNSTSSPSARHSPPAIRHFPITGPICAKRPSREAGGLSPRVPTFSTASRLRKHGDATNSLPLAALLHSSPYTPRCTPVSQLFSASFSGLLAVCFRIHTYEKRVCNPCRICTSKTQDLKSFRIRTYEKTTGGWGVSFEWDSQYWLSPYTFHLPRIIDHASQGHRFSQPSDLPTLKHFNAPQSPATNSPRAILPPVCAEEAPSSPHTPAGGGQTLDHVAGNFQCRHAFRGPQRPGRPRREGRHRVRRRAGHLSATAGKHQPRRQCPSRSWCPPGGTRAPLALRHAGISLLLFRSNQNWRRPGSRQHTSETSGLRIHPQRLPRACCSRQRTTAAPFAIHSERKTPLFARDRGKRSKAGSSISSSAFENSSLSAKSDRFRLARIASRAHQQRRARFLALLLRKHRRLQGLRPSSSRHGRVLRVVRQGHFANERERPLLQRRASVFCLWPRKRRLLPSRVRSHTHSLSRPPPPRHDLRGHRALPPHAFFLRSHKFCSAACPSPRKRKRVRSIERPPCHLRRRIASRAAVSSLQRTFWRRNSRFARLHGNFADGHRQPARRSQARLERKNNPRLRSQNSRRTRQRRRSQRNWGSPHQRRFHLLGLLEQTRKNERDFCRRLVSHRRQILPRRRRLFLVRRTLKRCF